MTKAAMLMILLVTTMTAAQTATRKTFDVVSIKPHKSIGGSIVLNPEPTGRFVATNETVKALLRFAFFVFGPMDDAQLTGGPDWITSDRYDVEAQAGGPLSYDDSSLAVRAMLEDRFQLRVHREKRELPVYILTIGKDGSKMKSVDAPAPFNPALAPPIPPPGRRGAGSSFTPPPGMIFRGLNNVIGSAIQTEQLASVLSSLVGRLVIDKTNLTGYFDIKMEFASPEAPGNRALGNTARPAGQQAVAVEPEGPSIFTALQEQLGLRLESAKAPVEVIVIDSIQRPSEN